jgi:pyruvate kinase
MSTKLLVTLGPSSLNETVIKKMDVHDIFVFRINLSHTPYERLEETINEIRKYTKTPICIDSEGSQIRNQYMKGDSVFLQVGEIIKIHFSEIEGDNHNISFTPNFVAQQLKEGDILNIDFHSLQIQITEVHQDHCNAIVLKEGKVGSNKAVDLDRHIYMPALTEKDKKSIELGKKMGISHFALSFANSREDVVDFRKRIGENSYLISKIESRDGLINLDDITENSNAILIDRGDLSRQVPIHKIPFFQRRIVSHVRSTGRNVFVATNLLETMIKSKEPTRAEMNDIVSSVLQGANGLVLAAETAIGKYPVECVEMIRKTIIQCECWTPNTSISELLNN